MKRLLIAFAALALSGCDVASQIGSVPASPAAVADRTKIDEQAGITVTLAYTATAKAAALAIRTGLVKDPAAIQRIGQADAKAYAAVQAVRSAYLAGNASSFATALTGANAAIGTLANLTKGL